MTDKTGRERKTQDMTGTKEDEVLAAYEAWDPDESTVSELAADLGISRQRLYQILEKHDVVPKTRRKEGDAKHDDALMSMMAENALAFLLNQIVELREELREYRIRFGPPGPEPPRSDTGEAESTTP